MAIAPGGTTITREMINAARPGLSGATLPDGLYIRPTSVNFIPIMSKFNTPMNDRVMASGKGGTTKISELKYGEGDLIPMETTIVGTIDASQATITLTSAAHLQVWMQVRHNYERMLVREINGNVITVDRGFGGSTAETGANLDKLYSVAPAQPEGANYVDSPIALGDTGINYCEIFEYTWKMTHRGQIRPDEEVKTDRFKAERNKKSKEAAIHLDQAFLWGQGNEGDGTAENPSTMSGLVAATNAHANPIGGAALQLIDILNGLQTVAMDVGRSEMAKEIMGGYRAKAIFATFFKGGRRYPGAGDIKLQEDGFDSDFGPIKFVVNDRMNKDDIMVSLNGADWDYRWMEGGQWTDGLYSSDGWYDIGFLRCDVGALWMGDRRRCKWTGFATDDASYPNLYVPG